MSCSCWREGLATSRPFSAEFIVVDESGRPPLAEAIPISLEAFWRWCQSACEHPHMQYVSVWLSTWRGVELFRDALRAAGADHVRTLLEELPTVNGGLMSVEAAVRARDELEWFRSEADLQSGLWLIETESGELIHEYYGASGGVFMYLGRSWLRVGFDDGGLFVLDDSGSPSIQVFRAKRVAQIALGDGRRVRYTDLDRGGEFEADAIGITLDAPGDDGQAATKLGPGLHVERRLSTAADYAHIVEALTTLCAAAIETGTPVTWT